MIDKETKDKFSDWISFQDDDGSTKEIYVKILEVSTFVKFQTEAGNTISVPYNRVNKIKQRGVSQ